MPRVIWQGRVAFANPSEPGFVGRIVDGGNGTMAVEVSRADAMGRARWDECPDSNVVRVLLAAVRALSQIKTPELNVGCILNLEDGRQSNPITAQGEPYQWPADPYADGAEPMRVATEPKGGIVRDPVTGRTFDEMRRQFDEARVAVRVLVAELCAARQREAGTRGFEA